MTLFHLALFVTIAGSALLITVVLPAWLLRALKLVVLIAAVFWALCLFHVFPHIANHRIF